MKKIVVFALLSLFSLTAYAAPYNSGSGSCYYNCVTNEITEVTNVTNNAYEVGLSDELFAEGLAMSMAMSSLQFDFSDSAVQVGVGGGWYDGENAAAIGIAKRFGDRLLLNASYTEVGDHGGGGAGATWRF